MSMQSQPSQPISEKRLASVTVLAFIKKPPSPTSTVKKTSSTGISATASFKNTPKHNGNGHLQPIPEKKPVSNSAFSANSARQRSFKNYGFNPSEERALNDSDLKVAAGWRQFVSSKSTLIELIKALRRVLWGGDHPRSAEILLDLGIAPSIP
jgi:hypothetical protein